MKFELEESNRGVTDEELLEDMRRAAEAIGRKTITMVEYEKSGKVRSSTIQRRDDNLVTKCLQCNLGNGNAFNA